jgi:hypothetical protein
MKKIDKLFLNWWKLENEKTELRIFWNLCNQFDKIDGFGTQLKMSI